MFFPMSATKPAPARDRLLSAATRLFRALVHRVLEEVEHPEDVLPPHIRERLKSAPMAMFMKAATSS